MIPFACHCQEKVSGSDRKDDYRNYYQNFLYQGGKIAEIKGERNLHWAGRAAGHFARFSVITFK
jgi:hypothetical protein